MNNNKPILQFLFHLISVLVAVETDELLGWNQAEQMHYLYFDATAQTDINLKGPVIFQYAKPNFMTSLL